MLRCLVALVACASGDAFAVSSRHASVQHRAAITASTPRLARAAPCAVRADATAAAPEPAGDSSPLARAKAWFGKWAKFDKSSLQTLGVDAFFTYGVVSNLNVAITAALAWGAFCKSTGLSPLAPGQLKGYTAAYGAIYISLGTLLRPLRMALAVSLTPLYTRGVGKVRASLPFRETRPKLNRTLALVLVSLLTNVLGTGLLAAFGVWIASLVTGVSIFPPGYSFARRSASF